MSKPVNNENFSLEEITAEIKQRVQNGVKNAVEIGRFLILAQKKLEGTGKTLKEYCAENFTYALSTLELYKRLAENLEKWLPIRPSVHSEILQMGILEADGHFRRLNNNAAGKAVNGGATNNNTEAPGGAVSDPTDFSDVNEPEDDDDELPYEEDDKLDKLRYVLEIASSIIDSQNENQKEETRIRNFAAKYIKGTVTLDQVPDIGRKYPQSPTAREASEIGATA